ncbi:glycosyltransferase [Pedobacter sp. MR22-3]|uniref:glycosyltransferase n=1 Tax=Pedobacter sp. MR22-3 TaxID=2994552 RepID=UPI00224676CE|nr:glycosyltransferase [Pedobacter sp. MR22-3]MCX2586209.1 glycosyltransferase [Pedobacter sp. MR22-3]
MQIIFFSNPDFFGSEKRPAFSSMPRFTNMLVDGMRDKSHEVSVWTPGSTCFDLPFPAKMRKWMGYIDQYVLFPIQVKKRLKKVSRETIFVFTDQAQGPWMPLVQNRNHVMHCHDFLAQWSALGEIKGQEVGLTGRMYQKFIRDGFKKGKNFITSSYKTDTDLKKLLPAAKMNTYMIYNGLEAFYKPLDKVKVRASLSPALGVNLSNGYILHVGGNHWYKNRKGVIEIYNAWRSITKKRMPLLLVGPPPDDFIAKCQKDSSYRHDIHFLIGQTDEVVSQIYAGASLFLFPSFAEGFGWPSAEAMACGCPVITSNEAPMTEVVSDAGFLIPLRDEENPRQWATDAALVVEEVLNMPNQEAVVLRSLENAKRFNKEKAMDDFEQVYDRIVRLNTLEPA